MAKGASKIGGGAGAGGGATIAVTSESIKAFEPLAADRGAFTISAMGGNATVSGYVDNQNQIGYRQNGNGTWTAFDLVTGRSFASTGVSGGIRTIINQAANNINALKAIRG